MKRIEAIVKPFTVDAINEELHNIGVAALTVYEVKGFGRQKGNTEMYRGAEYLVDFLPKSSLNIVEEDYRVESVIDVILSKAFTGKIGGPRERCTRHTRQYGRVEERCGDPENTYSVACGLGSYR